MDDKASRKHADERAGSKPARPGARARESRSAPQIEQFSMVISDPNLPDNPIIYVNKSFEKLTQYTGEFSIGRNCRFLQGEGTDPDAARKLREGIEAREDVSVDILNYRADGSPFMNRLLLAPLYNDSGEAAMYLGIQREVPMTSDGRADAADGAAEAAAGVALASMGAGDDGSASAIAQLRRHVSDHLSMLLDLVNMGGGDLAVKAPQSLGRRIESLQLLFEELDQGGVSSVRQKEVPVGAYLSRVAATLSHLEGRRSIRMNVDCDERTVPTSRAARLGLLLSELLLNSYRHAFQGRRSGVISFEFKVLTDDRARMVVRDDGVGIRGEDDWPYTRDEASEDAEERRSGHRVGAKLVRELLDGLGAVINVKSDAYGTTTEIGIPLDR